MKHTRRGFIMDELLNKAGDTAKRYFKEGFHCSEAITLTFEEYTNITIPDEVKKGISAFVEGIGGAGCICGALNATIFLLSMQGGRLSPKESTKELEAVVKKVHDNFREEFSSACCRVITKKASKVFGIGKFSNCPKMVEYCIKQLILSSIDAGWLSKNDINVS